MTLRARHLGIGVAGAAVVLAGASLMGPEGISRVRHLRSEVGRIERLNGDLEDENRRLVLQIHALREDSAVLEAVARDELGLVRPGEVIFRFEPEPEVRP